MVAEVQDTPLKEIVTLVADQLVTDPQVVDHPVAEQPPVIVQVAEPGALTLLTPVIEHPETSG